mmetsp:Transcript_41658/g.95026  ORF Transcript_41658/g.95026 Transcript_41658/m.95026 type:complete len:216 (-) Transcript_41658:312-959(-)
MLRTLSTRAARLVAPRAAAAAFPRTAFPARSFSVGIGAGNYNTPGFEPSVGTPVPAALGLQKARTWDEAVADGFKITPLSEVFKGKVALFVVPGAFTGVCELAHVPSFAKNVAAFKAKGVDRIVCISVDTPYAMNAWKNVIGKNGEGIEFYGDTSGAFAKLMGKNMDLSAAALGTQERSNRYAAIIENGVIKVLNVEAAPSDLKVSTGDELLKLL